MLSYSIAATVINGTASSIAIAPPPAYAAGDLLVLVVTGGSATAGAAVSATAPSGWTRLSSSGAGLSVFTKTATGSEPASYTVTTGATATIAAYVAAYPAATVASHSFSASGSGAVSYTGTWPSAGSSQLVLAIAAAVASGSNAGYQNVVYPPGLTAGVPVFGQALPDNTAGAYPCAAGLSDVTGSVMSGLPAPVFTTPQPAVIYAGFIVLTLAGASAPLTVTAACAYPQATPGLLLTVKALSGAVSAAQASAAGAFTQFYASGTSQAPAAALTPAASGSWVYGAVTENFAAAAGTAYTANGATTFSQNASGTGNASAYGTFRGTASTTAGTPVTLGGSAPANAYFTAALAEVPAAPGHSLSETATATATGLVPGNFATTSVSQSAVFPVAPPAGSLLVAMVSANSLYPNGNASVTIADSAGLTWWPLAEVRYPSYSGVWAASTAGALTASASLTVTPSRSASRQRGRHRTASATVTPARRAAPSGAHYTATAALTVTPSRSATPRGGPPAGAVLDESGAPVLDESGAVILDESEPAARYATASLTVTPSRSVSRIHGNARGASLTVTPSRSAVPSGVNYGVTASLAVTPALTAAAAGGGGTPADAVLDESGSPVLDEAGAYVLDESTPGAMRASASLSVALAANATGRVPSVAGPWSAARAGLPGDSSATNWASQAGQFLTAHGITPVYAGTLIWTPAAVSAGVTQAFSWLTQPSAGWLPAADVDQPFEMAVGATSVGRVQVPVLASGNGADLQVLLCADNGSGSPLASAPLASAVIPASHILAASATGSLASAGPLATARHNTSLLGAYASMPWTPPAVSANGAGSFATPATSGNFTVLVGGYDSTAHAASGYVAVVAYQGTSLSGGAVQPALPQPAWFTSAAVTADSVVVAGGLAASGTLATVWTAPWTPGTGTVGAWSSQQALPAANVYGAMAAWGSQVYVIGGSPNDTAASATSAVWTASAQSGQVTAWTAAPSLPQKVIQPYAAVVGNWLVVAGGQNTSGTTVAYTWYSAINADGSLAGWQQGPALPQAVFAFGPGWNLAVTDSAVVIVSGFTSGTTASPFTQALPVSPDGPAGAWQAQQWGSSAAGVFAAGAYPAGPQGQWQVAAMHNTAFDLAPLGPVALVSVPLPATGLTSGDTYHVVMRQLGGSASDGLTLGVMASSGTGWKYAPRGADAAWTATSGSQVAMNVYNGTASGNALHLVQDSGAGLVTLVHAGATGLLTGVMESASFPSESPEAVLGTVTQVTWNGSLPSGLVTLA
jgi:hypothetical protein